MNEFKAMLAMQVVTEHIRQGLKHPSPVLVAEAVDVAEAVIAEIDKRAAEKAAAAAVPDPAAIPPVIGTAPVTGGDSAPKP